MTIGKYIKFSSVTKNRKDFKWMNFMVYCQNRKTSNEDKLLMRIYLRLFKITVRFCLDNLHHCYFIIFQS